jgi:hypothetical protein
MGVPLSELLPDFAVTDIRFLLFIGGALSVAAESMFSLIVFIAVVVVVVCCTVGTYALNCSIMLTAVDSCDVHRDLSS